MFKLFYSLLTILCFININTPIPNESSILDIKSSDKGILIPRVSLTSIFDKTTVKALNQSKNDYENSLLIYTISTNNSSAVLQQKIRDLLRS